MSRCTGTVLTLRQINIKGKIMSEKELEKMIKKARGDKS